MLKIRCDFCKKQLNSTGGLLFGPPEKNGYSLKTHLCRSCYKKVINIADTRNTKNTKTNKAIK